MYNCGLKGCKVLKVLLLTIVLTIGANADFLRVWAGANGWQSDISGSANGGNSLDSTFDIEQDTGLASSTNSSVWIMVKHFVPLLPNVRVERTSYLASGNANTDLTFAGKNYNVGETTTDINLDQTDLVLYYNFLDNTVWLTLDAGLGLKYVQGELKMSNQISGDEMVEIKAPIPYGYLRGRANIPTTNIGIEADIKYISISGITISDARAKVDVDVLDLPLLEVGLEAGYRVQSYNLDSSDVDAKVDLNIEGMFFGANVKF